MKENSRLMTAVATFFTPVTATSRWTPAGTMITIFRHRFRKLRYNFLRNAYRQAPSSTEFLSSLAP